MRRELAPLVDPHATRKGSVQVYTLLGQVHLHEWDVELARQTLECRNHVVCDRSALIAACSVGDRPTEIGVVLSVLDNKPAVGEDVVSHVLRDDGEKLEGTCC
jgi:hypothetical protein